MHVCQKSISGDKFLARHPWALSPHCHPSEATSRLFEKGVFEGVEVAAITGHKTLQMLKRYTHLRAADLAQKLG